MGYLEYQVEKAAVRSFGWFLKFLLVGGAVILFFGWPIAVFGPKSGAHWTTGHAVLAAVAEIGWLALLIVGYTWWRGDREPKQPGAKTRRGVPVAERTPAPVHVRKPLKEPLSKAGEPTFARIQSLFQDLVIGQEEFRAMLAEVRALGSQVDLRHITLAEYIEACAQVVAPYDQRSAPTEVSAPARGADTDVAALTQLADLHQRGILTDDEFAAKKRQVLRLDAAGVDA
ncbi:hypothetical protein Back2_14790 [Nocardioides baekrokdamisoli]|uniref:SHOCT domain-containing protein n=1 Tax=Nocardioides baekrokdamisoli TaxID=1804624 RepID=A0A3G9IFZ8_9ACTN|nr:SHOCT domain-containing protein [Nocardioides baekrokdamisoli]BBH17192.1 hypothetical protein Back2_14790 [Nocardioides baekrokdamisoli]